MIFKIVEFLSQESDILRRDGIWTNITQSNNTICGFFNLDQHILLIVLFFIYKLIVILSIECSQKSKIF